ncbi:MAG: hypothetical protein LBJ69_04220 [Holosporales bacterium]|jgi:F0F1-type ATP synthase epsilon subunit|nr:hypothetical protein [Holosporales bacterium]
MNLVLICNEEKVFDGAAVEVNAITDGGPVTILPQHKPYLTKISGNVSYMTEADEHFAVDIIKGFLYTNGTDCFVVIDKEPAR